MRRRSMKEISEEIKSIISVHIGERKVFAKDIATALGIPHSTLNTQISRDRPPFEEILHWCAKTGLDPIKIFYERGIDA